MKYQLILASASPRRKKLLAQIGAEFEIIPATGEEIITSIEPEETVLELSGQKAREVAENILLSDTYFVQGKENALEQKQADKGVVVLGADTVVAFQGRILGKPTGREDASRMLKMLSGNTHSVFTGVTMIVLDNGKETKSLSFYEETKVTMYPMTEEQIQAYVNTGEPMDKAGAYGIQGKGAIYIEKIVGDYPNVVGLPLGAVYQKLEKSGIEIL
ncbi:septum formation protein Maf [Lachnospiraceae bacterium 3-1]|nr:septum formation protein Maf [Lachnospiraceae bacterium 3-1]